MSVFQQRATGTLQDIDAAEVTRAASILFDLSAAVQIQGLPSGKFRILPADDSTGIVRTAREFGDGSGVYWTLNPCPIGLETAVKNPDIINRRWLLIDVDAERPADTNSTDEEHDAARETAGRLFDGLMDRGFPQPISLDSGNGWHLLYRVDLPNDDASRVILRDALHALGDLYDTPTAKIDRAVYDARRISKLPGTWARKGQHSIERPYRIAKIHFSPDNIECVPAGLLLSLAALRKKLAANPSRPPPLPPREQGPIWQLRAGDGNIKEYVRTAVLGESRRVREAAVNTRNNTLNDAAFRLGTLAGAGLIRDDEIEYEICLACRANGLMDTEEAKTLDTLRRAIKAGRAHPRTIPERSPSANGHATKTIDPKEPNKDEKPDQCSWVLGINDLDVAEGTDEELKATLYTAKAKKRRYQIWTLDELIGREFPAPNWAIAGLLSEGLNIMAGAPKMGKSMMALNLGITIAAGGHALGEIKVAPGDVLYLSLEDKDRRVQARARKMQTKLGSAGARRLSVVTTWPRQDEGGLWLIDQWVQKAERPTLVIIDVWGRFRTPRNVRGEMYEQDSTTLAAVKQFVDDRNFSALVLHHTRKAQAEDFMETLLGTQGIAGAADGVIHLQRSRGSNEAIVSIVGRDEPQKQLAVEFDPDTLTWRSLGTAEEHIGGKLQAAVLGYLRLRAGAPTFPNDVAEHLSEPADKIRPILHKLLNKGLVRRVGNAWAYPGENDGTAEF